MPRTLSMPAPSSGRCPVCDGLLSEPRCPRCGVELASPDGGTLWRLDHRLHALSAERDVVVERLLWAGSRSATPPPAAPLVTPDPVAPVPPTTAPRPVGPHPSPAQAHAAASGPSVAEVLVALGGLSLVAAVVVFAAVTWTDLAAWAQGGVLVAATVAVLGGAIACRRRDLGATAEALAGVAVTLAVADVHVARVGLDTVASPRSVWAVGLAVVACGAWATGRRTGLRTLVLAGAALAFLPVPLLALGASSASVLVTTMVGQALAAAVIFDLLGAGRLERAVVGTGAVVCWAVGAVAGLGLAGAGLAHDPAYRPIGAAALLAALAIGSVLIGRRHHSPILSAAGSALAFIPPVVAAVGSGAVLPVLWVLGAEALLAAVVARRIPEGAWERPVLDVGALGCGAATAAGGVLLGVARLVDHPDTLPVGAVALLAALAAASILLGRAARLAGLAAAGVGLGFLPAVLAAAAADGTTVLWVLGAEAALGLVASVVLLEPGPDEDAGDRLARDVARAGAATTWLLAAGGAAIVGLDAVTGSSPSSPLSAVRLLLSLTGVATTAALWARWGRDAAGVALVAATSTLLGSVALAQGPRSTDVVVTTVALAAGAVALGVALLVRIDRDRPWTAPLVAAGATVAGLALIPLQSVVAVLAALAEVTFAPTSGSAGQSLVDRLSRASTIAVQDILPTTATLLQLASVALLGGGLLLLRRRVGIALLTAAGVATAVVAPVVADLATGPTVIGLALLVLAGGVILVHRVDDPTVLAAEAVLVPVLLAVSVASAPLAVAASVLVTALAGSLAVLSLRAGSSSGPVWVGGAMVSLLGGVVVDSLLLGASGSGPALVLAATALVASVAAPAIERWAGPNGRDLAATVADVVLAGGFALALVGSASLDSASVVVAGLALAAGATALRPTRRPLWLVSVAATVAVVWMRLAVASVDLIEAYALPLAGALLAVGLLARRGTPRTSWERFGAALIAGLAPTAYLAVTDADPVRTVAVVVAGVAVTLWGAVQKEQAPLALGGAAVAAVAVRHLGPVAAELPRWIVLATAGVVLLATGATFEQRRRDLHLAREAFTRLG